MRAPLLALLLLGGCVADRAPPRGSARAPAPAPPRLATPAPPPAAPAWRPARVLADAPERPARTVTAAPGEGLAAIARREGVPTAVLAAANRLAAPYTLTAGQMLAVPGGRLHSVKRGETLSAIARAYRAQLGPVAQANQLSPPYTLEIGDTVFIPSPPRLTLEERARANRLNIDRLIAGLPAEPGPKRVAPQKPRPAQGKPSQSPLPPGERVAAAKPRTGEGTPPAPVSTIRFDWPLEGRVLSAFGRKPGGRVNDGVNIAAIAGAQVKAAADGQVIYAGTGVPAFGGLVLIRHADGWITAYGHNEALLVARGDPVTRGQPIARAGATGEVDSPQLHFEIRRGRTPVNPLPLLPGRPVG